MDRDVFISYSSKDKASAEAACTALEAAGLRCWIAPRDIPYGVEYATAIVAGLSHSRVVVVIFSASANASPDVRREVQLAENRSLQIVPLRIENVEPTEAMAYFLSAVQWFDALTPPLERHLEHLASSLKAQLGTVNHEPVAADGAAARAEPAQPAATTGSLPGRRRSSTYVLAAIVTVLLVAGAGAWWSGMVDRLKPPPPVPPPVHDPWVDAQLKDTSFDVFFCEAGNRAGNEAAADRVLDRLGQNPTHGRLRKRLWSIGDNQQPGYNVKGYQIRYENAGAEKDLAGLIKPAIDPIVSPNAFVLYQVQNKTPSYLSLFVCPS